MSRAAESWRARGRHLRLCGHRIFTVDVPATGPELHPPLLILHGFPTSSFDFHAIVDRLATERRVLLFDMLGYGLSDKPDLAYSFGLHADIAMAYVDAIGVNALSLLTHDVGDTLGGELLARHLEGGWGVEIAERTLTNGSIYFESTQLSAGQRFLLGLPDQRLPAGAAVDQAAVMAGVTGTFSPGSVVDDEELAGQWEMISSLDGQLLRHASSATWRSASGTRPDSREPSSATRPRWSVVWGRDDPIAVPAMTERLRRGRPDIRLRVLEGVGHYPMVEAPSRFLDAVPRVPARPTADGGAPVCPSITRWQRTSPWMMANQPSGASAHLR